MYQGEFNERLYLLPHRPAPDKRTAILWSARTPRPVPVVFGFCQTWADRTIRAEYDIDELNRALIVWRDERGIRLDVRAIIEEVFGKSDERSGVSVPRSRQLMNGG